MKVLKIFFKNCKLCGDNTNLYSMYVMESWIDTPDLSFFSKIIENSF